MPTTTAHDYDQDLLTLFDAYVHGHLDRRGFLDRAAKFAVGGVTASMLLDQLSPNFAEAQKIPGDDPRLDTRFVEVDSPAGYGKLRGYLVRPKEGAAKLPALLVIHENRGLNPHIEDVTRRFALEGYLAFAPDALFPVGGYPGNEDDARTRFGTLDAAKTQADFLAAFDWIAAHEGATGKVGAVGFCWGGGMLSWLATQRPTLAAGVPFYGSGAPTDGVPKIKAPLLVIHAEKDDRINAGWPEFEAAMKAAGTRYERILYPGTQHGFHNDTTPRFDEAAAKAAWEKALAFFAEHLKR